MTYDENKPWQLDVDKVKSYINIKPSSKQEVQKILKKSLELQGITPQETAILLNTEDQELVTEILQTAGKIKQIIYGKRIVLFAPMYTGNVCMNDCTYCGFRKSNTTLKRSILNTEQIRSETVSLLKEGHKRVLMLCGESKANDLDYFIDAIKTVYDTKWNGHQIRRINVEIAPLDTPDFAKLKKAVIGTYACFQETYDPELYATYHKTGPKADYSYRLNVMHRAMKGGIDDVGIGVLFGLADYRFEVIAMLEHAHSLENYFGCGPHTISVPRIEPADDAPTSEVIPYKVNDEQFKRIIAVLRISLPYTGIILSTRESEELRNELFQYGVSQISAGSRTNPGAYADEEGNENKTSGSQFSLGDHRSMSEVIQTLIDKEYIPSFCTGCYRKGRVGSDFMDLAKPGLIHQFCVPNALFTFKEYLEDFADKTLFENGSRLITQLAEQTPNPELAARIKDELEKIGNGKRDVYF